MTSRIATAAWLVFLAAGALPADQAASFFDDSAIREVRLSFDDANWYNTLLQSHQSDPDDPYFPCRFQSGATALPRNRLPLQRQLLVPPQRHQETIQARFQRIRR